MNTPRFIPANRILVVMPNWLGDAVMATPFLRALRDHYPDAHITALATELVAPVLAGSPRINETRLYDRKAAGEALPWIKKNPFDLAVLLPNSWRSALLAYRARIPRRLGYTREFRRVLLTDFLRPQKRTQEQLQKDAAKKEAIVQLGGGRHEIGSPYQPIPTIDYYLKLAETLGALPTSKKMELAITPAEQTEADDALANQGVAEAEPLAVLVPGANFGASKCWPPERFAQVADLLMDRHGEFRATVVLASSPAERPIIETIMQASQLGSRGRLIALARLNEGKGISLGALKRVVQRSRLMLCNDTGPRHFAAALDVPVITLFGPTDPIWAETFCERERQIRLDVPCSPCQLKKCPIDHRCMTGLSVDIVLSAARQLWQLSAAGN